MKKWMLLAYVVTVSSGNWIANNGMLVDKAYMVRTDDGELVGLYSNKDIAKDMAEALNNAHANRMEPAYWSDPGREVTPPGADDFTGKKP